jgi:hypothetical protein
MVTRETPRTIRLAVCGLGNYGEANPKAIPGAERASVTEEQI